MRVAVIGAGPAGVAAAIAAADRGHDVALIERERAGASLLGWGTTRFFSPFSMNATPRMRELLGSACPDGDALLTGPEYVAQVLEPLCSREPLAGRVREGQNVVAIARRGLGRTQYAGHPLRSERPFHLLVRTRGEEEIIEAEVVLDASGGLLLPAPAGAGGLPPLGEQSLREPLIRTLGALHSARERLRGVTTLLTGDGHSAANAICALEGIAAAEESTRVIWCVRTPNMRPCTEIANDLLPERARVASHANDLASRPPTWLRVERRAMIERVRQLDSRIQVALTGGRIVLADAVAAFTGYRPDPSFTSELALELSPVTEGGARLYRAISNVTDCLTVPRASAKDLETGEPGYWFIGSRAYGRSQSFLLKNGFVQTAEIVCSL